MTDNAAVTKTSLLTSACKTGQTRSQGKEGENTGSDRRKGSFRRTAEAVLGNGI